MKPPRGASRATELCLVQADINQPKVWPLSGSNQIASTLSSLGWYQSTTGPFQDHRLNQKKRILTFFSWSHHHITTPLILIGTQWKQCIGLVYCLKRPQNNFQPDTSIFRVLYNLPKSGDVLMYNIIIGVIDFVPISFSVPFKATATITFLVNL